MSQTAQTTAHPRRGAGLGRRSVGSDLGFFSRRRIQAQGLGGLGGRTELVSVQRSACHMESGLGLRREIEPRRCDVPASNEAETTLIDSTAKRPILTVREA